MVRYVLRVVALVVMSLSLLAFASETPHAVVRGSTAEPVLQPGDILVKVDGKELHATSKLIQGAQKLLRALTKAFRPALDAGDPNGFHVLMYIGNGRTAEAYGGSLDTAKVGTRSLDAHDGYAFRVYRSRDAALRARSVTVAQTWATGAMKYQVPIRTVFHTSDFGPKARAEALRFAQGATRAGGPAGYDKMFCSEFVIAVYQAAALLPAFTANPKLTAQALSMPAALQIHASNASPLTLQGHLQRDVNQKAGGWESVGLVGVSLEVPDPQNPALPAATAPDVTAKLVSLGNPTKERFPKGDATYARNPWSLIVFDGKLYAASGNSNNKGPAANAGPVDLWTLKVGDAGAKWLREYEVSDEQVDLFRVIDGELWIPGHDSHLTGRKPSWLQKVNPLNIIKDWAAGNLHRHAKGGTAWERLRTIPNGIHVYDLLPFDGKLFVAISTVVGGEVAISADKGRTWKEMLTDFGPGHRSRSLLVIGSELFASTTQGKAFRYDAGAKKFKVAEVELFPGKHEEKLFAAKPVAFGGRAVYIGAKSQIDHDWESRGLFVAESAQSARRVQLPGGVLPHDLVVAGETIYVLASAEPAPGRTEVMVLSSRDLRQWSGVLRFTAPTFARSFALHGGSFFFGLGSNPTDLRPATGEIYQVPAAALGK